MNRTLFTVKFYRFRLRFTHFEIIVPCYCWHLYLSTFGGRNQNRTDTPQSEQDFKSCVSTISTMHPQLYQQPTTAYNTCQHIFTHINTKIYLTGDISGCRVLLSYYLRGEIWIKKL